MLVSIIIFTSIILIYFVTNYIIITSMEIKIISEYNTILKSTTEMVEYLGKYSEIVCNYIFLDKALQIELFDLKKSNKKSFNIRKKVNKTLMLFYRIEREIDKVYFPKLNKNKTYMENKENIYKNVEKIFYHAELYNGLVKAEKNNSEKLVCKIIKKILKNKKHEEIVLYTNKF